MDRQSVDDAMVKGIQGAIVRHQKDDLLVVVERHGKIERVKPEDLGF